MTKATPQVQIAEAAPPNPIMAMVVPGRRALGETWSRVTIHWDPDERAYILRREDAEAPADGRPVYVPALGNASPEIVHFLLDAQLKEAEYRKARGPQGETQTEMHARYNRLWHDFVEQKLKWFLGQSQSGPGGMAQREKVRHRNG